MGERRLRSGLGLLERFGGDARGAIAPLAAVVIGAMLIGSFGAIDIARLVTARNQLQDAVDSAALSLGRMPPTTSDTAMQTKAQAWILANVTDPDVQDLVVGTPVRSTGQIQVDITAAIKTTSAALLGVNTLPFEAHSTVKYGVTQVELALVLDNTGSMNDDGKLNSLKTAATTLVNTLNKSAQASGIPNALKIAVVPFTQTVNIGAANQGSAWLTGSMPSEYGADTVSNSTTVHPDRFALLKAMNTSWGGCVESRPMPYDVQETAPTSTKPETMFVPFFSPDTPDEGYYNRFGNTVFYYGSYAAATSDNWSKSTKTNGTTYFNYSGNNYLTDGVPGDSAVLQNKNGPGSSWTDHEYTYAPTKYKTAPYANVNNHYWNDNVGPNSGCDVQPLQRLTTDVDSVLNQINGMTANGNTEIPIGLVWGWHVLSPLGPFADGAAYGSPGVTKVVVLVTDGANTYGTSSDMNFSLYTSHGWALSQRITTSTTASDVQSALNSRLQTLCKNMKSRNSDGTWKINIYTVPLEVTDANIKSLLQGCVTDPANYVDTTSSSQLASTFQNIAGSIQSLRMAH